MTNRAWQHNNLTWQLDVYDDDGYYQQIHIGCMSVPTLNNGTRHFSFWVWGKLSRTWLGFYEHKPNDFVYQMVNL